MHGANSSVERDLWLVFEGNVIVRLFSELFSVSLIASFPCRSLLLGTNIPNDRIVAISILTCIVNLQENCGNSVMITPYCL